MTLPSLGIDRIGEDVEFFPWDGEKQEVLPTWKWWPKQTEALVTKRPFPPEVKGVRADSSGSPVDVFRDGLAVEVNVRPTRCRAWLWQDVMLGLMNTAPKQVPNFTFTTKPYVEFSEEFKKDFPEDLRVLGCNPTLDAYTGRRKHVSINPMKINFRTSGSHLHMSFFDEKWKNGRLPEECWAPIVKLSDLLIGLPATYIFADELEFKRRKIYGQAGEFRFQPSYGGIEYRVLSSRIFNHPGIFSLFTGIWKYVIPQYVKLWEKWDPAWEDDLQLAINEGTGMELFFPVWDRLFTAVQLDHEYVNIAPLLPNSAATWQYLRKLNLAGEFPDGGVYSKAFPEAHIGWSEWAAKWGLAKMPSYVTEEEFSPDFDYFSEEEEATP